MEEGKQYSGPIRVWRDANGKITRWMWEEAIEEQERVIKAFEILERERERKIWYGDFEEKQIFLNNPLTLKDCKWDLKL